MEQVEQKGTGTSTVSGFFGFLERVGQAYVSYDLQSKQIVADQVDQTGGSYVVAGDEGQSTPLRIYGYNVKTVIGNVALAVFAVWAVRRIIKM